MMDGILDLQMFLFFLLSSPSPLIYMALLSKEKGIDTSGCESSRSITGAYVGDIPSQPPEGSIPSYYLLSPQITSQSAYGISLFFPMSYGSQGLHFILVPS